MNLAAAMQVTKWRRIIQELQQVYNLWFLLWSMRTIYYFINNITYFIAADSHASSYVFLALVIFGVVSVTCTPAAVSSNKLGFKNSWSLVIYEGNKKQISTMTGTLYRIVILISKCHCFNFDTDVLFYVKYQERWSVFYYGIKHQEVCCKLRR